MFMLQKISLRTELKHDEVFADSWRNEKDERLVSVKNNACCTVFSYALNKKMTRFGLKDCLSLPGIGWKQLTREELLKTNRFSLTINS